jgi:hypothetical protein
MLYFYYRDWLAVKTLKPSDILINTKQFGWLFAGLRVMFF